MLKIGHRGAAGYEPENTLRSFERAIQLGCDMLEADVHVCKSGDVVVIHDDTVDRTTTGEGKVANLKLKHIKALDAGLGERVPTLEEVLNLAKGRVKVNIELKGKDSAKPVAHILNMAVKNDGWLPEDLLVCSFRRRELVTLRSILPWIRIGLLIRGRPWGFRWFAASIGAYSLHLQSRFVTRGFVRRMHAMDFLVFPWTANSFREIRRLRRCGVDGIISDMPDRLNEAYSGT